MSLLLLFSFVLGQAGTLVASAGTSEGPSATLGAAVGVNAAAALDAGDITLDSIAAGPGTYNHATGVGGAYNDRTISKQTGVVESLEGEDFACGDLVVFFTAITVDPGSGEGAVDLDYTFAGQTTSGSHVGYDDLVSVSINDPDTGNENLDGDESASIQSESHIGFGGAGNDRVEATIRVSGVDAGEQIILRYVLHLYCDPTETSVTGNIHDNIDSAVVVGGQGINVGAQTVPLKQAGNILVPGLNVLKECPATATVGETITYSITVQNTGSDTLNNLVVSDPLLGGTLAGFPTSLAAAATVTKTFTHVVGPTPDPLPNTVTATATAAQSSFQLTDTADCEVDVLFPGLQVDKTANPAGPVSAGQNIGFDLTVTNNGPGKAFDVVLTDVLPSNPGLSWTVGTVTGGWTCAIASGTLTCGGDGFDLASGASASVRITSPTERVSCAVISNTAVADASNTTPVQDIASVTVQCPNLGIVKTADASPVSAGDEIGYTITVTNAGPGTAFGVVMTDTLPTNAGLNWSVEGTTGGWDCDIAAGILTCGAANFNLTNGQSASVHIVSPTTSATCGQVQNSASVSATNNLNVDSQVVTIVVECASLMVTKEADDATVNAGDDIGYTITVTNFGEGTARGVVLNDTLPTNDGLAWTIDGGTGAAKCSIAGGDLTCNFGDMAPTGPTSSYTVHISSPTTADTCGVVRNYASATSTNDGNPSVGPVDIEVLCPDVTVEKTADDDTIDAGDLAEFTIVITNAGDGIARDVMLEDTLPTGVAWSEDSADCSIAGGLLTCDFGDLEAGESRTIHVWGTTDATDCGVLVNVATVSASNEADDDAEDNQSEATITVECPAIDIEKTADAEQVDAGEPIGFTITVTNSGPGDAYDVAVSDTLPANPGLAWTIDSQSGEACFIEEGELSCSLGTMLAGDTYEAHISSDTDFRACGVVDNTATVTISNGEGDEDDADLTVNCPDLGIDIEKGGPDLAHVGDIITYTFDVTLTTPETLYDVVVTDPNCNEGAPVYQSGDDGDGALETEEVWSYTCSHLVTEDDPDPLPNTATVVGHSDDGREVSDEDDHVVDLIHPDIRIVKTVNPISGEPGDTVTYTYKVTNTGDTTLYDVTIVDDVLGEIGNIPVLEPGQTVTLTKDWVLPSDDVLVINVAVATGEDVLGEEVSDDDDAVVTIVEALNPPTPPGPTAFTGTDAVRYGMIAAMLLGLGLMAMAMGRRRRIDIA
ncbi:MAG: CARDB domain-containing protein [Actinomycetota bacterium]